MLFWSRLGRLRLLVSSRRWLLVMRLLLTRISRILLFMRRFLRLNLILAAPVLVGLAWLLRALLRGLSARLFLLYLLLGLELRLDDYL